MLQHPLKVQIEIIQMLQHMPECDYIETAFNLMIQELIRRRYRYPEFFNCKFPGFWMASWETVERVVNGSGNFEPQDVQLISLRWKGDGTGFPDVVRQAFDIPHT